MIYRKLISLLIAGTCFISCNQKMVTANGAAPSTTGKAAGEAIPYKIAERYFVSNEYTAENFTHVKVESKEEFKKLFGAAPLNGKSATAIDFSTEYVIAVIGALTEYRTSILPVSLLKKENSLQLNYRVDLGEKTMATIRPAMLLIVNRQYQGDIQVKKE